MKNIHFSFYKTTSVFFVAALLMLGYAFINIKKNDARHQSLSGKLEHTSRLLFLSQQIHTHAVEMQAAFRGYLVTSDTSLLSLFDQARTSAEAKLQVLKVLTASDAEESNNVDSLVDLIYGYVNSRKNIIGVIVFGRAGESEVIRYISQGKELSKQIRNNILSLQRINEQKLASFRVYTEQSIRTSTFFHGLFLVLTIILLIIAFALVYYNLRSGNKAAIALRESNDKFFRLFQFSPLAMAIRDINTGEILDVNNQYEELLGYKKEELIGKTAFEAGIINDNSYGEQLRKQVAMGKYTKGTEAQLYNKTKQQIHVSVSIERVQLGHRDCILSALLDITDRKIAEEQVKQMTLHLEQLVNEKTKQILEKEQQYKFLIENMHEGIIGLDFEWKYKLVNRAAAQQRGCSREDLIGYTIQQKNPGIENSPLFAALRQCMENYTGNVFETEYKHENGASSWFELSIQPEPQGLFILSRDITHRKKSELQLKKLNEQLENRAAELQESNTELERFAYVASHDLQEPLRMVSSFLHLLEKKLSDKLDDSTRKYIEFAVDGAERMKRLIQDLLKYSRVGTSKESYATIDCNRLLDRITHMLRYVINEANATVNIKALPVIDAAESQIEQLFLNLISNAIKYHGILAPEVEVGCIELKDVWQFYVRDTGIGIDPKFFEKIFIIFQRLHNKSEYAGTGIGLAVCKKIVERHGGKIWVESASGKGATFFFTIPKNKAYDK